MAAYQALGWVALALGWPVLLLRALRDPRYRVGWAERAGAWGAAPRGALWIHGASVGEMGAAAPLIEALRDRGERLLLTTTSPSGREAARRLAGPEGAARLLPLDLTPLLRRALEASRPRALVVVETELWPGLLAEVRRSRLPALLVNARISDRTFPRYRALRRWVGPLLDSFREIQAQSEGDAARFRALGGPADRVRVGGNLKFDRPTPDPGDPAVRAVREADANGINVVVAGSTHPGEEATVLAALRSLAERGLRTGLVLAPRHLERLGEVEALLTAEGVGACRWSRVEGGGVASALGAGRVVLVDRYGLLGRLYGGGRCAFVGGTLVPVGGHNLLEPLAWGVPVLFGPHTENAREVRDEVLRRGLGTEVRGVPELAAALEQYLGEGGAAEEVRAGAEALFAANRGAAARAVQALDGLGVLAGEG